ncbi:MAG: GldG family protein [Clostridia bacterium]
MKINKRKLRYASVSTVFMVLFVVVVMLVNVLAGFLTNRFSLKLDMTSAGMFKLTEQTQKTLKELNEDITIYIMSSEAKVSKDEVNVQLVETVREFGSTSGGKVKYEFIDPNLNPKFYDDYPKAKSSGAEGEESAFFIIKGSKRYDTLTRQEMVAGNNSGKGFAYSTEAKLGGAILFVTSEKVSKVATIEGHNEKELAALNAVFDGNSMERSPLNLTSADIPKDVNNMIISAPTADYTPEEIAKIDAFLAIPDNNLFVFWGSNSGKLPVLERFLSDWGIQVGSGLVLDATRAYQSPIAIVADLNKESEIAKKIGETQLALISPATRQMSVLWEEKGWMHTVPLAMSSNSSFARTLTADINIADGKHSNEEGGPFPIAIMSEKNEQKQDKLLTNRVFVFGTTEIASDSMMSAPIAINNTFINTIVGYCNENTNTVEIMPKIVQTYDLNFYESQIKLLMVVLLIIIPLAILGVGVFIFAKRRHK